MDIWENIPVEIIGNKNYNKITGKVAGDPQQKGEEPCTDAEKLSSQQYLIQLLIRYSQDQNGAVDRLYGFVERLLAERHNQEP